MHLFSKKNFVAYYDTLNNSVINLCLYRFSVSENSHSKLYNNVIIRFVFFTLYMMHI